MSIEIVTIASNAVIAKMSNPSREAKLEVQRLLSYMVAGAENSDLFKSHRWDGRSSFLDFKGATFPAGFIHYVAAGLTRAGYKVNHVHRPRPEPLGPENPKIDSFPPNPDYDYQEEVMAKLVKHGRFIAQVATGGGKSRIGRLCFARINRPTLFLTTRSVLMYQMKDAFEALGVSVSVLGDGQFGHTMIDSEGNERQAIKKMSVGMVQTFVARLREPVPSDSPEKQRKQAQVRAQTIRLLEKFEFVIGEEAHEAGGNSYYEILRHCKNAHYRLALTATPFMKDDEEANMRLHAAFGPIGIRVTEKLLIDRGILAKPYFKYIASRERPNKLFRTTAWASAYRLGITDNVERNAAIVHEARKAHAVGLPVMILVKHVAHGNLIADLLSVRGIRARFIKGENDQDERQSALNALRDGDIDALIGSTILDVGVDVPAVGMVILAGGGKAEVALRQRVGRGLRSKKVGPNICLIVDFSDQFNNHLHKHAQQRMEIIRSTPGFGENILAPGAEFDYAGLGLLKAKSRETIVTHS